MINKYTRRTPGLETPKTIIPRWVKSKGPEFEREFWKRMALSYWPEIVGKDMARKVKPMAIRKKVLLYHSFESTWNLQTRLLGDKVINEMNKYVGFELINEVRSTRLWEKPEAGDVLSFRAWLRQEEAKIPDFSKERMKTGLNSEEEAGAKALAASSEDDELGELIGRIYRKNIQLNKVKSRHGWVSCTDCGSLTEPGAEVPLCYAYRSRREEAQREAIRKVLADMPWARPPEVAEYVPGATPKLVAEQRAMMVQQLAAEVDVNDRTSLKAMQLVMLFRVLPPDQLTEDNVERAMYDLRFSLHRPKDYVPPKRYSKIKLGREGKAAQRAFLHRK